MMITAVAYAKINLNFEILGKRTDGFHNIASILQKITLSDKLAFEDSENITLECNITELNNENNLVYRAAKLLQSKIARDRGARIILHKHIPTSAGLGGGSSDAATTLVTLNEIWNAALPPTELENIGAELGSDIPFFIQNTTALVEGRGEKITTLNPPLVSWVVLVMPPIQIQHKTQRVFSAIKEQEYTNGETILKIARQMEDSQINIENALAKNHLEDSVLNVFQGIEPYREEFLHISHSTPQVTGAGPTYFSIFSSEDQAQIAAKSLENLIQAEIIVASTIE